MFNVFTHLEEKAALEKYADSLNKIIHDHLEKNPNTSPRDVLLHHARNCELENCGEDEPVTKRKRLSDGATTKQTTKRKKTTPLLERNQNLDTVKSMPAQNQKKAVKAREESSIKAMQQMHTSMAVSKNFLSSFPSTTQSSAQMQVRKMSSEITSPPLVVTGLQTPTARSNNIQQGNAITQRPGQCQARERSEVTNPLIVTGLQTPMARPSSIPQGNTIAQRPGQYLPDERSEVGTSITELQTPTARLNNRQQEDAIFERPRSNQVRGRSPERVQLNVAEREDPSSLSSFDAIAEVTSMPGSDLITPPSTEVLPTTLRGMPHSNSVNNGSASYDMWRSSMTALLDMEAEEFEQMSNLASDQKNADHDDLYEENQALRKENQQLKEQLMNIRQQNDFSHPGK